MSVSLSDLRSMVFRRLGDRDYDRDPENPTAATVDAVDDEINVAIESLVKESESRGGRPLRASRNIYVGQDFNKQTITISGSPTAGKYRLSFAGKTTDDINFDDPPPVFFSKLAAVDTLTFGIFGVSSQSGNQYDVLWPDIDNPLTPRPIVPRITVASTDLSGGTDPSVGATATAGSNGGFFREYDLGLYLVDPVADGHPANYAGSLFVERTDLDEPVNVFWPNAGDFRTREMRRRAIRDGTIVTEELTASDLNLIGDSPSLYMLDDTTLGYVETPTTQQILTCTYASTVTKLVSPTDTLQSISLPQFDHWKNLIALMAARILHADISSPSYQVITGEFATQWRRFTTSIHRMRRVAMTHRSGGAW